MSDPTQDQPGASGELPHWWARVPKPLQQGTGEYQPPGYPTTTSLGVPTRFVPGPLSSSRVNQALDELQAQIGGFVAEAPQDGALYGRGNAAWAQALPVTALAVTLPVMDGAGAAGAATTVARADHVHPVDTSRYAVTNPSGYQTAAQVTAVLPVASSTTPVMNGTAAAGSGTTWARGDHVHPADTSRAPLASPTFTGTVTVPTVTPATDTTTNAASTAFVQSAIAAAPAGSALPLTGGTLSGNLSVGNGTAATQLKIDGLVGTNKQLMFLASSKLRFSLTLGTTAESGGNVGSDLVLTRFADDGTTTLGSIMTINRSTGSVAFGGSLTVTGNASFTVGPTAPTPGASDNSTRLATTAFVQTGFAPLAAPVFTGDARAVTPAYGDSDTSIATTGFVQAAVAPDRNNVGRNLLHNSMFNIAQRGAGPFTAASVYTLDRWSMNYTLDAQSITQAPLTDAHRTQIGDEAATACIVNAFTGNAGASSFNLTTQMIEDVRRLSGKNVTLSFYAAASAGSPKLGASLDQIFGSGGSAAVIGNGQAVTLSTTFARYTLTFTVPSTSGKTVGADSKTGLNFWFSSGTTQASRAGSIGVQSATILIWGVQLEIGSVATPLEKSDPQQDLAKCQRFYQTGLFNLAGYGSAAVAAFSQLNFATTMRATPTVTSAYTTQTNCGSSTVLGAGTSINGVAPYTIVTATGAFTLQGSYTASAEL